VQSYDAVEVSAVRFKPRHWMEMINLTIRFLYPHQELLGSEDGSLLGCSVVSAGKLDCLALKMEALYSFETPVTFPVDTA
jgi:hypothetical protein